MNRNIFIENTFCSLLAEIQKNILTGQKLMQEEIMCGCVDGKIIGTGQADYTVDSAEYDLTIKGKPFALIDIPGIEGDESKFKSIIEKALKKAHIVFYVNGSLKKPEPNTVIKIKNYLRHDTSVYALFNTHCSPKKEREAIDKTYEQELQEIYKQEEKIIAQSEKALKPILGEHYKKSMYVNGLLSFCARAIDGRGKTSIIPDTDIKTLRRDQVKYLKEYDGNIKTMQKLSNMQTVEDIIAEQSEHFDDRILSENLKKLRRKLEDSKDVLSLLQKEETKKIHEYINAYDNYLQNCNDAKSDFLTNIKHLGNTVANDSIEDMKEKLFKKIEDDGGKTSEWEIRQIIETDMEKIVKNIEPHINTLIARYQNEYQISLEEAQRRLLKDFERTDKKFSINLSTVDIDGLSGIMESMQFTKKDFGKALLTIGSLILSSAMAGGALAGATTGLVLGSVMPGIGNAIGFIIGGAVGLILGVFSSIWDFFAGRDARINKCKQKIQSVIDDIAEKIQDKIDSEIAKLHIEKELDVIQNKIVDAVDKQKQGLEDVKLILKRVTSVFENKIAELNGGKYGTI